MLIVGAGLAGLSAATFLAWQGVKVIVVERHAGTSKLKPARGVNLRSMELLRLTGIEDEVFSAGANAFEDFTVAVAETVAGREFNTIISRRAWDAWNTDSISPARRSRAGQDQLESILRRRAAELGADIRFRMELLSYKQDETGVTAFVVDATNQERKRIRAQYLVAADGHHSGIRQSLGIGVRGLGTLSFNISILFEADLTTVNSKRGFSLCYLRNPEFTGVFVNTHQANIAFVSVEYNPSLSSPSDFTTGRCVHIVRSALGIPQLEVKIIEVQPWEGSSLVADRFSDGRIFLIGDAAHAMTPTGGLGGQTAIQDAFDLGWKLSMVVSAQAHPSLLATYECERKPVAELTTDYQVAKYVERMRPDRTNIVSGNGNIDWLEVSLGYRYRSRAIAIEIPDDLRPTESPYRPTGRPGSRGAHLLLERSGQRLSVLDLIGRNFVFLTGPDALDWANSGLELAKRRRPKLEIYHLGVDVVDVENKWEEKYGVGAQGAVLLRPDGYVAWRSKDSQTSHYTALEKALDQVLCQCGSPVET